MAFWTRAYCSAGGMTCPISRKVGLLTFHLVLKVSHSPRCVTEKAAALAQLRDTFSRMEAEAESDQAEGAAGDVSQETSPDSLDGEPTALDAEHGPGQESALSESASQEEGTSSPGLPSSQGPSPDLGGGSSPHEEVAARDSSEPSEF